jgi:hypothetical protein
MPILRRAERKADKKKIARDEEPYLHKQMFANLLKAFRK